MTWVLATGYAVAAAAALMGLSRRGDPHVAEALGVAPGAARTPLEAVGARVARWVPHRRLRERMAGLGRPDLLERLLAWKLAGGTTGALLGLSAPVGAGRVAAAILLGGGAWTLPEFVLARRLAARREALGLATPDLLDLMDAGVSAGLTPRSALERAVDGSPPMLRPILEAARERVALGDRWSSVLGEVADREGIGALRRVATVLERSVRYGAPVEGALRALARDARAERDGRLEERAGRAPVAMLFPLVFCILPAFVLSAVVPAALVAIRGVR